MLERLNEEIRRRTYALRICPNSKSWLRLVRALAAKTRQNWMEANRSIRTFDMQQGPNRHFRRNSSHHLAMGRRTAIGSGPQGVCGLSGRHASASEHRGVKQGS